jgi:hypothetical protein
MCSTEKKIDTWIICPVAIIREVWTAHRSAFASADLHATSLHGTLSTPS